MENKKGILEEKLSTYYKDVNLLNYRVILAEAIKLYRGEKFDKILDIGSGVGSFLESIKPFGFASYALEGSEIGFSQLKKKGFNTIKFFLEKGHKLPFPDNFFSLVVFNQVIEHLEKETGQYFIQEIIRVLEPGGVGIIKSPSYYAKIWRTDPHHIYCWKPYELLAEINRYNDRIENISIEKNPIEPWMLKKYNEKTIDFWHKYNKQPRLRSLFIIVGKIFYKLTKSEKILSVSNISFTKKLKGK
jgi:SAM-dependent methyltransferase